MIRTKLLLTCISFTLCSIVLVGQKVSLDVLDQFSLNQHVSCMVELNTKADLTEAKEIKGKAAKATFVYNKLRQHSTLSQKEIIQYLKAADIRYQSFYVVNGLKVEADLNTLKWLEARPEVRKIYFNERIKMQLGREQKVVNREAIAEWGIKNIKADSVWQLGFKGKNIVIGGQDTGYKWDLTPIKSKYRGWNGSEAIHDYNWHDAIHDRNPLNGDDNNPCGYDSGTPCDDHNHGTHTMGTMVGSDADTLIGVAPEAQWIGCRNMDRGKGQPSSYIECFEWFLAPTSLDGLGQADPTRAPHVINNSWGCPETEGCNPDNWQMMNDAISNLNSSGVVVVVSAGNDGPNCNTISNAASIFDNAFTIGASDKNDSIARFSSRGSVSIDNSFRIKPDVAAPGVQVRSIVRNGEYRVWNGTSMAGPHVAGTVALMINANPNLEGDVETIQSILRSTARYQIAEKSCDDIAVDAIPNTSYGYGVIDAYDAVQAALNLSSVDEEVGPSGIVTNIKIYPNPTSDFVLIDLPKEVGIIGFRLFDLQGRMVVSGKKSKLLDLRTFSPGMYILNINTSFGERNIKIIKND